MIPLARDTGSDYIKVSLNPKLYGFFKDLFCLYAPKLSWPVFPTMWNAGGKTSKICKQHYLSVRHRQENVSRKIL